MAFAAPLHRSGSGAGHPSARRSDTAEQSSKIDQIKQHFGPTPRFIHNGNLLEFEGNVFDKLLDPSLYTGTHKHRFDQFGRGRGVAGRREDYALLDSGVVEFDAPGGPEDAAGTTWTKSLRAAVHSPSLAKRLGMVGGSGGTAAHFGNQRRGRSTIGQQGSAVAPLVQAWRLDESGGLTFDEARTRELAREQQHDGLLSAAIPRNPSPRSHSASAPPPSDRLSASAALRTLHPTEASTSVSKSFLTNTHAVDAHKRSSVTSHVRRLLYDEDLREAEGSTPGGHARGSDRLGGSNTHQQPRQHGSAHHHSDSYDESYLPAERKDSADAAPSLQDMMKMLYDYEHHR